MFESNTRSATVIGAIVGGGIGLLLTQAISTQKDWEEVAYYMVLIVLMVMAMDSLSGWLRRKLIKGDATGRRAGGGLRGIEPPRPPLPRMAAACQDARTVAAPGQYAKTG